MNSEQYTIVPHTIENILSWIRQKSIAIPDIQRPFVWSKADVRDLIDSLYKGYPVGYIITWHNSDASIKGGASSQNKVIMIDGQQRITALRAALEGESVKTKDYTDDKIVISFNPLTEEFKVRDRSTERGAAWIADISTIIRDTAFSTRRFIADYHAKNPELTEEELDEVDGRISRLLNIRNKQVGAIELSALLSIETVTEIFIRINRTGTKLNNADFAMSKIAVHEEVAGDEFGANLRKFIDYFCEFAVNPQRYKTIQQNDISFANYKDYMQKLSWLARDTDDLYDPSYKDMLQVISLTQFSRGKLADLVALLSGRNFETREFEDEIVHSSFQKLEAGVYEFVNENQFKHFVQDILRSACFNERSQLTAQNAINYAYAMYLRLFQIGEDREIINRNIRKLFVLSSLTGRVRSSIETTFEHDIKQLNKVGDIERFVDTLEHQLLGDVFWTSTLPERMDITNTGNAYWNTFVAAQKKLGDDSFLRNDNKVKDLTTGDIHHIFPKDYLSKHGYDKTQINKIANYMFLSNDINIKVSNTEPKTYMNNILSGENNYGSSLVSLHDVERNLAEAAIPKLLINATHDNYAEFMQQRRMLMADKIRKYYASL